MKTNENIKGNAVKYCFSYIRFSSKKQELGSSLERQEPIAERVAREKGWAYEPKFNAKNLGVSAYKGDNKKTLEIICQSALDGKIPQSSVMILEALDRATRLSLDEAQDLIKKILRSGLEIYTDTNKRHLTKESLNNVTDVIVTAVELDAAYQYSKKLSDRSNGGFKKLIKQAQAGEKVYFGGCMPSFIKGVKNGEFVIDEAKRKLVKRIFTEYLDGKSKNAICDDLNKDSLDGKIPTALSNSTGTKWQGFTITSILRNKAYTGDFEYKGIVIPDYIPSIVSKEDFKIVKYMLEKNAGSRRGGSPSGNINSIFNGSGKCICGSPMVCIISTRKSKKAVHQYAYYVCSNARLKVCKKHTEGCLINNADIETDFLMRLRQSPAELIGKSHAPIKDNSLSIKADIAEQKSIIKNALLMLKKGIDTDTINTIIDEAQAEVEKLEKQLQDESVLRLNTNNISTNIEKLNDLMHMAEVANDDVEMGAIYTSIKEELKHMETRKKLVKIIPTIIKEIKVNPIDNGYTIINHENKESKFFQVR